MFASERQQAHKQQIGEKKENIGKRERVVRFRLTWLDDTNQEGVASWILILQAKKEVGQFIGRSQEVKLNWLENERVGPKDLRMKSSWLNLNAKLH